MNNTHANQALLILTFDDDSGTVFSSLHLNSLANVVQMVPNYKCGKEKHMEGRDTCNILARQ